MMSDGLEFSRRLAVLNLVKKLGGGSASGKLLPWFEH